jgi:hypothetical protein
MWSNREMAKERRTENYNFEKLGKASHRTSYLSKLFKNEKEGE